jgi:hypothetical protein
MRDSRALLSFVAVFAVLILFPSCSAKQDIKTANEAVGRFHNLLDAERFAEIYDGADQRFQQASGREDMLKFFAAVHRKLGNVRGSAARSFNISYFAGQGKMVVVGYYTTFERGAAQENFTWHMGKQGAQLVGYQINSNVLAVQ